MRPHAAAAPRSSSAPVGLLGEFTHSINARAASAALIAARSRPPAAFIGTATGRQPARIAPISYVGYDTAGNSTVSRSGRRSFMYWGAVATNSFEPTQAAICDKATSMPKRRFIQSRAAERSGSEPMLGGYPRSEFDDDNAATTAGVGGSHGVPIDKSMTPPSCAAACFARASSRSYGYGGGTKGWALMTV